MIAKCYKSRLPPIIALVYCTVNDYIALRHILYMDMYMSLPQYMHISDVMIQKCNILLETGHLGFVFLHE